MTLPAADRAYRHTKDLILAGKVTGGAILSEVAVAEDLGISRTPVHEAFLRLESERLLELAPRRGATVVPMAPQESRDVLEMREAIEVSAARRALTDGPLSPESLDRLRQNLDAQRSAAPDGPDEFAPLDSEFHAMLLAASGNTTAIQLHGLLRDRQHRLRHRLLTVSQDEVDSSLVEHEQMFAAAESGDAEQLCELISAHIRRYRGLL